MNDVFDRLLEHVLRDELHAARRAQRAAGEIEARVAVALAGIEADIPRSVAARSGARAGAGVTGRGSDRRVWQRWLPLAIAAAAGIAVAATWLAARRPGLSLSRPLLVATGVDEPFAPRTHLDAAAFAWCAGDSAVELTAADGTTATVEPDCAFAVDPRRRSAELLAGALELHASSAPWRVATRGVVVLVASDGAVRVALTFPGSPQPRSIEPDMTPNDLRARLRFPSSPAVLTVLVLAGTAELVTAQGAQTLSAGEGRRIDVAAGSGDERAAVARARQLYTEVRTELPLATDEASTVARKNAEDAFQELLRMVAEQSAGATALRPAIAQDLAGGKLGSDARGRVVQLALLDNEDRVAGLARRQWQQHSEDFGLEAQIALAERGFAPAMAKVREAFGQVRGRPIARLMAALAVGGDESSRAPLGRFLRADVADAAQDIQVLDARCHAAVAMQAAGDAEPMRELRTALVAQVEKWIASGEPQQLALADACLQRGEYWLASERPRLSWPEVRIAAASQSRGEPTAASLRARAAALAVK